MEVGNPVEQEEQSHSEKNHQGHFHPGLAVDFRHQIRTPSSATHGYLSGIALYILYHPLVSVAPTSDIGNNS